MQRHEIEEDDLDVLNHLEEMWVGWLIDVTVVLTQNKQLLCSRL